MFVNFKAIWKTRVKDGVSRSDDTLFLNRLVSRASEILVNNGVYSKHKAVGPECLRPSTMATLVQSLDNGSIIESKLFRPRIKPPA
jgi:hypothetical protein